MGRLTKRHLNGVVGISEYRYYNYDDFQKIAKKLADYEDIGTEEEFRELRGKATAKKPIYSDFDENEDEEIIPYKAVCPVCGYEFEFGTWNDEQNHHCECGQRMLWD